MSTDVNMCDCGWAETRDEDSFSPHRQKCPNCGREFFDREEIRWFK